MDMVRKYQPDAITNFRYGWIGDITEEEGGRETKGPIRNAAVTMEDLRAGQKIARYTIETQVDGKWKTLVEGRTVGHKRIDSFTPVTAAAVRFTCTEALDGPPAIRRFTVFQAGPAPAAN